VTFAPTADDTSRTTLPKELRLTLINHKKYFFKGGLTLPVNSSIPVPPDYIFQAALLTLLSLEQTDKAPTPTDRPRQGTHLLAGIPAQGHDPWLAALLRKAP
jgi:hypothetical protein